MRGRMRFSVLASGSQGNACYVETSATRILVDAGLSCKEIIRRLENIGVEPDRLDGLFITHEHSDHIKGAGVLSRRFDLPLYLNKKTLDQSKKSLGDIPEPVILETGHGIVIKDLHIDTFTKCHDAVDPVGLVLSNNGLKLGIATDLGRSTRLIEDKLKNCHALIIEFNYDQAMLDQGPYPLFLKKRIKGPDGHLSNSQAAELVKKLSHGNLKYIMLAHLSEANNLPEKASLKAEAALSESDFCTADMIVCEQHDAGPMIEI